MDIISGIYIITHTSGKQYVGSSNNIEKRLSFHKWQLSVNKHHARKLQRSWNKYGADTFTFSVLEITDDLVAREQHWMDVLKPFFNSSLVAGGGCTGYKHTDEAKRKMSEASRTRIRTQEHKDRISKALTGKVMSEETKRKISETKKAAYAARN